jgi:RNA polymerase sigma-54 factor
MGSKKSLQDQIRSSGLTAEQVPIAELIIRSTDEYGYLESSIEVLASSSGYSTEELGAVLNIVQTFEPAGIAARDLRECLMLQLQRAGRSESTEYRIVADFMRVLGNRDLSTIAGSLGITIEEAERAVESLTQLEPRPLKAGA